MADLIDRLAGDSDRPRIALHRWKAAQDLYAFGLVTRTDVATEFDMTGYTDEIRQAIQLADNIDAQRSYIGISFNSTNITWTNQPAALTELFGNLHRRTVIDLTHFERVTIACRVSTAGAASAVLYAQYSTDGGSNWSTLTSNQLALNPAGTKATAWELIPSGARGIVQVRIVGVSGDGAVDPVIGLLTLGLDAPYNRAEYLTKIEAVLLMCQVGEDRIYHNQDGSLNKTKVFADLGIEG